jgi:hypothetical protein
MDARHVARTLALGGLLLFAGAAEAAPPGDPDLRGRCAVQDPPLREQRGTEEALGSIGQVDDGDLSPAAVTVPVHFHVITTSTGGADVSSLVPAQMDVLNVAYAGAGFAFELASLEVVPNDAWFFSEAGSPDEVAMKAALRRGGSESLNVYTTNGDVYLGWATFPISYQRASSYDGVVLYWATLPGTGFSFPYDPALEPDGEITYDQGDTGTHEVGHWLGLYHTFQGGCANHGDKVSDTAAEAEPQFFCAARDSCTGKKWPGMDPITNFMDYVDDVCMDEFTADQTYRMQKAWKAFRR